MTESENSRLIDRLVGDGCQMADEGNHAEAVAVFREAAALGSAQASLNMGNSLRAIGADQQAFEAFRDAARAGEETAWLNLAIVSLDMERWQTAVDAAREAIATGDEKGWGPLGVALLELGDEAGAEAAFIESSRTGDSQGMLQYAFFLDERGRYDEALPLVERASAVGDEMARGILAAWRWIDTRDVSLEQDLRNAPSYVTAAREALADLLLATGRGEEAAQLDADGSSR